MVIWSENFSYFRKLEVVAYSRWSQPDIRLYHKKKKQYFYLF